MPTFECTVCGVSFDLPDHVLEKYPGWTPKFCRKHTPNKKAAKTDTPSSAKLASKNHKSTSEHDLTPQEVLATFSDGPQSGVFTDGGSRPNPGPGGWGVVHVKDGKILRELSGGDPNTTNNRMELTALTAGIKLIEPDQSITIYTDSELCVNTINKWAAAWKRRGWKRKNGPVENLDLVRPLFELFQERPHVKLKWIKAHNGWLWNEYADALASSVFRT
ncbi:MAG: ribonuclease HI [Deltaproteobacteria bacterium]|nr:ribonuclease HI [Deltaproteobacteria bacterium]